jgi:membrane fusion protein (multidrug efflux system)
MSAPAENQDLAAQRQSTRAKRFRILGVILAVAAVGWGIFWALTGSTESTDDAFIESDVAQISPQIGGQVLAVHFEDNAFVHRGDLLVEIDPRDAQAQVDGAQANVAAANARVAQAEANLDMVQVTAMAEKARAEKAFKGAKQQMEQAKYSAEAAKAELERSQNDRDRYRRLYEATFASRQKLESVEAESAGDSARWRAAQAASGSAEMAVGQASEQLKSASTADAQIALRKADLALALAQLSQAQADLNAAQLTLSYTRVTAPSNGRLSKKSVQPGDIVQKGQILSQLIGSTPWVVANFKEDQLTHMRPGQPVKIKVDAFPDLALKGKVDSIQPGTGSRFSLLPPENATGNFVKVVQRVPVKIAIDDAANLTLPLGVGMSVVPTVDIGAKPKPADEGPKQ